jgi:Fic family protein
MDIKQSPSGAIVKAGTGYLAFIPHPLPPQFEWDVRLANSLSRADFLLGKLSREGSTLPNPHLLINPFVTREAVLSSRIEGTQATLEDMLADEAGAQIKRNPDDVQEVRNYIDALEYGVKRLDDLPLSLRLIKEIHAKLMQGVRGSNATPGEFRRTQNWIGLPGCTLMTAKFVPPTPDKLMETLGAFELFLHDASLPPLIHIALCHYQFEAIHPFLDGNGRVGRLLIILLMIERKLLSSPLLYISAFFEATRDEYYRQLYHVSAQGTWHDWLSYFLHAVAIQSTDALSRAERINNQLREWEVQAEGNTLLVAIIKHLAVNPFLTVKSVMAFADVAFTTVQRGITKLESLGIISQTNKGDRNRIYCATSILAILKEPANITTDEDVD